MAHSNIVHAFVYNVQVLRLLSLLWFVSAAWAQVPAAGQIAAGQSASAQSKDTRVILLGTGTPNPEPDRMGPAVAVVSGDRVYIVDCGTGGVRRAGQAGL